MRQSACRQIDATLAIKADPNWSGSLMDGWRRALDELIEVDQGWEPELDYSGHHALDVWFLNVVTETVTIDATACDDVPDRVDAADWYAILDEDMIVDGRRLVRFDVSGGE